MKRKELKQIIKEEIQKQLTIREIDKLVSKIEKDKPESDKIKNIVIDYLGI